MNPIRPSAPSPSRWAEMAGEAAAEMASEMAVEMHREMMQAGGPRYEVVAPITPSQPMAMAAGGSALLSRDHRDAVDTVTGEQNPGQ